MWLYYYRLSTRRWLLTVSPFSLFVLLTHLLTFLTYEFLRLSHRLVLCLPLPLTFLLFVVCRLVSRLVVFRLWLVTKSFPILVCLYLYLTDVYIYGLEMGLLPIFNLLCNHPKGVTCEIPRTLLVLSSSLAKAIRFATLREFPSVPSLTGSKVQPTRCTSVRL